MVELTSVNASRFWKERCLSEHRDAKRSNTFLNTFQDEDITAVESPTRTNALHYNGSCNVTAKNTERNFFSPRAHGIHSVRRNQSCDDVVLKQIETEPNETGMFRPGSGRAYDIAQNGLVTPVKTPSIAGSKRSSVKAPSIASARSSVKAPSIASHRSAVKPPSLASKKSAGRSRSMMNTTGGMMNMTGQQMYAHPSAGGDAVTYDNGIQVDTRWTGHSVLYPVYVLDQRVIHERLGDTAKVRPYKFKPRASQLSSRASNASVYSGRPSTCRASEKSARCSSLASVQSTGSTTVSQQEYITALKAMLEKERIKRIAVESQVSKQKMKN